jgi:hypothetical protein
VNKKGLFTRQKPGSEFGLQHRQSSGPAVPKPGGSAAKAHALLQHGVFKNAVLQAQTKGAIIVCIAI